MKVFCRKAFYYNNHKTNKFENNSVITARVCILYGRSTCTINTSFFTNRYVDSFIDSLVEVENNFSSDNDDIQLKSLSNPQQLDNDKYNNDKIDIIDNNNNKNKNINEIVTTTPIIVITMM